VAGECAVKSGAWTVKTPHGYVGKEFLIARLSMLTTDVTISPKAISTFPVTAARRLGHWPQGEGKIFKISYTDAKASQPVIAWAAGPTEVRVAFDKPLDPSVTNAVLVGRTAGRPGTSQRDVPTIEFGEYVRAPTAMKFSNAVPGRKQQEAAPVEG